MSKKLSADELKLHNETYKKVLNMLEEKHVHINYPIIVNTSNIEKDFAWISCNYMGTGIKIPINEIDFSDFVDADPEVFKHCATWSFIEKKKNNKQ